MFLPDGPFRPDPRALDKRGAFSLPWILGRTGQPNPVWGDTIKLLYKRR